MQLIKNKCNWNVKSCGLLVLNTLTFKLTYYLQPHPYHSHMVCSRPCHWTDPSAVAVDRRTEDITFVTLAHTHRRQNPNSSWKVCLDSYQTLITVVSVNEAFAEATSFVGITQVSSRQSAQRVTGTSCQNTQKTELFLSDCLTVSIYSVSFVSMLS